MIYRSGSNVTFFADYRQGKQDILFTGGQYTSSAVTHFSASSFVIRERVTAFGMALGAFRINNTRFTPGEYLLLRETPTDLRVFNKAVSSVTPVTTLHRLDTEDEFTLNIESNTAFIYALTSSSETISVAGLPGAHTFNNLAQDSGGTVQYNQYVGMDSTPYPVKNAAGGIIEESECLILPGDTLFYVPPNYNPQPTGDGYQFSPLGELLQRRIESMDTAFVKGGLKRVGVMLQGLMYPSSRTFMPMGELSYALDDSQEELIIRIKIEASSAAARLSFTVDTQTEVLVLGDEAHFIGTAYGFACASSTAAGDAAYGLSLERNEYQEVFFNRIVASAPVNHYRDPTRQWMTYVAPYIVPGGAGSLIDRRFKVRQSAGPYLFTGRLDKHATLLVLGGAQDTQPHQFVGLLINGKVRQYAALGAAVFDSRLCLLIQGE